jgi:hypothetical protein
MPAPRRFPPPWSVEELEACFVVKDSAGQKLAYVYFEDALLLKLCPRESSHGFPGYPPNVWITGAGRITFIDGQDAASIRSRSPGFFRSARANQIATRRADSTVRHLDMRLMKSSSCLSNQGGAQRPSC